MGWACSWEGSAWKQCAHEMFVPKKNESVTDKFNVTEDLLMSIMHSAQINNIIINLNSSQQPHHIQRNIRSKKRCR
jgi:hypothetical protein